MAAKHCPICGQSFVYTDWVCVKVIYSSVGMPEVTMWCLWRRNGRVSPFFFLIVIAKQYSELEKMMHENDQSMAVTWKSMMVICKLNSTFSLIDWLAAQPVKKRKWLVWCSNAYAMKKSWNKILQPKLIDTALRSVRKQSMYLCMTKRYIEWRFCRGYQN